MKYETESKEVKQVIRLLAIDAGYGDPEYTNENEIDYKFWEDTSYQNSVIILARRIVELEESLDTLHDDLNQLSLLLPTITKEEFDEENK